MIYLQEHGETHYYAPGFGVWLFNFNKPKHSSLLPLCCSNGSEEQLHQVNIIIHFLLLKRSLSCWKITAFQEICAGMLYLCFISKPVRQVHILYSCKCFQKTALRAQVNTAERRKKKLHQINPAMNWQEHRFTRCSILYIISADVYWSGRDRWLVGVAVMLRCRDVLASVKRQPSGGMSAAHKHANYPQSLKWPLFTS